MLAPTFIELVLLYLPMHIVIVAIVACWKHLEKCHLSDEVQFGQQ